MDTKNEKSFSTLYCESKETQTVNQGVYKMHKKKNCRYTICSVADPGSGAQHPVSHFRELRNLNSLMRIRDLLDPRSGMEKFGSRIRNKHPGSATLTVLFVPVKTEKVHRYVMKMRGCIGSVLRPPTPPPTPPVFGMDCV
jgi:hypothetical protein